MKKNNTLIKKNLTTSLDLPPTNALHSLLIMVTDRAFTFVIIVTDQVYTFSILKNVYSLVMLVFKFIAFIVLRYRTHKSH